MNDRDIQRLARYEARKIEAYETILEGADEFLDCVDSEVLHKIISEEKRKVAKNMAKLEHYYRRSLGLSA